MEREGPGGIPGWFVPGADGPLGRDPLSHLDQPGVVLMYQILSRINEATTGDDHQTKLHITDQYGHAALCNVPAWVINGDGPPATEKYGCS